MECIFCKRAQGDPDAEVTEVVFDNDRVKAFYDLYPKAPVHVVVIPKQHIESIAHLSAEGGAADHREIVSTLIYAAKDIAAKLGLKGYKLVFNVGKDGGQVIDHLHLHILGGWGEGVEKKVEV